MENSSSVKRVVPQLCHIVVRHVESSGSGVKPLGKVLKMSLSAVGQQLRDLIFVYVFAGADTCRTHNPLCDATCQKTYEDKRRSMQN
jgi:hypothetical protein